MIMTTSEPVQKHQFPSSIESLSEVEKLVDELKEQQNIAEELYGNILVSLTEAVNNAIRHGNQLDRNKTVDLLLEMGERELIFSVRDKGTGFDYHNIPDPTHPDNLDKPYGRGIFIMKSLSDELEFFNDGREVQLTFKR
jgi:serine/threonine-protein kinase RsbW